MNPLSIPSTYGNLTLLQDLGMLTNSSGYRRRFAKVGCVCGNIVEREIQKVIHGAVNSCGCMVISANVTHGKSDTRAYGIWKAMRSRCNNPQAARYGDYGGRGIRVCSAWDSFDKFFEDMGEAPSGQSINRLDNDLGYFASNCEWATEYTQARNKRSNVMIEYSGKMQCLSDWANELGINRKTLEFRIKNNWPLGRAFTKPITRS
jgi:hypothetical protein